jgi:hypothetical protein
MSTGYSVYWGADSTAEVRAPDELDGVLDRIASVGAGSGYQRRPIPALLAGMVCRSDGTEPEATRPPRRTAGTWDEAAAVQPQRRARHSPRLSASASTGPFLPWPALSATN